jgi:hypothetical protein
MYMTGQGVPQDYAQAVAWSRKAAEQGEPVSQANLGRMYAEGQGVPQDYEQALVWYRKAAEQGNARGQLGLGMMYGTGRGVPQDFMLAYMWLNLAAYRAEYSVREEVAEIRDNATRARDLTAAQMSPDQIAEAQKMAREWKPK